MRIFLTSFGVSPDAPAPDSHYVFDRMPPASMSTVAAPFMPDYPALLLCDQVVVDAETLDRFRSGTHSILYTKVADAFKVLTDEGFILPVDFQSILDAKRDVIQQMVDRDLEDLDAWFRPLIDSTNQWERFLDEFLGQNIRRVYDQDTPLSDTDFATLGYAAFSRERVMAYLHTGSRRQLITHYNRTSPYLVSTVSEELRVYLTYVNSNIALATALGLGFHDWEDYAPFYEVKFCGLKGEGHEQQISKVDELFEVAFPEFEIHDPHQLIACLKDRRISELRRLVDEAVRGSVTFDREFAVRILLEVFHVEQRSSRYQKIVSYLTSPLGLIPGIGTLVQAAAAEVVSDVTGARLRTDLGWFYLISGAASRFSSPSTSDHQQQRRDTI